MLNDKPPFYGYIKPLFKDSNGHPKYMLGPHCNPINNSDPIFLTSFSVCFIMVALFFTYQLHQYSIFWKVILSLSSGSFLLSYLYIGFSKPGIAMSNRHLSQIERSSNRYCNICEIVRSRKT